MDIKKNQYRYFALNPRFNYLPDQDKYLLALEKPSYRFNVIGVGSNGQEHMRVTALEGRATIHGVFDPNPGSIEAAKQIQAQWTPHAELVVYDTLSAACHDPAVDGLIISTPNHTHLDIMREAVKSGKHILLEKPMATTIRDAYEIMQMAETDTAVIQIGLQYRFKSIYVEAIQEGLVRQSLGNIKTITILEHRVPFLDKVGQWNKFSEFSGGTLVEKCCHYFDLMNLFAQSKPKTVYATGSMAVNFTDFEYADEKSDILDNAFVNIIYENGIRANFNLCMFAPMFYEELILCGDQGRLKATENQDFLPASRPNTSLEIMRGLNQPSRITTPVYPTYIQESGHSGSTFYEHVNFIDNLAGRPAQTAGVADGFWSIVVGAAAEESVKTGLPVDIEALLKRNLISYEQV